MIAPIAHQPAPQRWYPAHFLYGGYAHFVLVTAIRRDGGREVAEYVLNTASLHLGLGPALPEGLRARWLASGGWVHVWLNCPDGTVRITVQPYGRSGVRYSAYERTSTHPHL